MKFFTENFCGALRLQHLSNAIIRSLVNIHGKTFAVLLKTAKTRKFSPANLSPFTVYSDSHSDNVVIMFSYVYIRVVAFIHSDINIYTYVIYKAVTCTQID